MLPAAARDLPVVDVLEQLGAALEHHGTALLVAPPGAGKTTVAPLALIEQRWLEGRIVMLEPRRLATRAAAQRMATLLGTHLPSRSGNSAAAVAPPTKSRPKTNIPANESSPKNLWYTDIDSGQWVQI